jgi:hypothetical protein
MSLSYFLAKKISTDFLFICNTILRNKVHFSIVFIFNLNFGVFHPTNGPNHQKMMFGMRNTNGIPWHWIELN